MYLRTCINDSEGSVRRSWPKPLLTQSVKNTVDVIDNPYTLRRPKKLEVMWNKTLAGHKLPMQDSSGHRLNRSVGFWFWQSIWKPRRWLPRPLQPIFPSPGLGLSWTPTEKPSIWVGMGRRQTNGICHQVQLRRYIEYLIIKYIQRLTWSPTSTTISCAKYILRTY
jgi:hypothetical protein